MAEIENGGSLPEPKIREYYFILRDGTEIVGKGLLAVAATFVAIGTEDGSLSTVVPMEMIKSVIELPETKGQA